MKYNFPIESERVRFRLLTTDDIPAWTQFFINNPQLHFVGVTDNKSPEEQSAFWIERQMKRYIDTGIGIMAAISKETGQLIGNAGIIWRDEVLGQPEYEIGYSVIPELWGKGYAAEMAIRLREYFEEYQIAERVISIIHVDNIGSQKVAEKNKMSRGPQFEFLDSPCYLYSYNL